VLISDTHSAASVSVYHAQEMCPGVTVSPGCMSLGSHGAIPCHITLLAKKAMLPQEYLVYMMSRAVGRHTQRWTYLNAGSGWGNNILLPVN
jgi:hypothetical protein